MACDFKTFGEKYLGKIENKISSYYDGKINQSQFDVITDALTDVKEYCLRPGKRIRPLLVVAGYTGYSGIEDVPDSVIDVAAAIEIFHSYLLVHDDIIDKAVTRRGGKSLHRALQDRYYPATGLPSIGVDEAIIFGDVMCFHAFEIVNNADIDSALKKELTSVMISTYEMTAWGQALDIYHTKPKKITKDDRAPLSISEFKTAYYTISNPYIMGMVIAGKDSRAERKAIEKFALPLGIAFQLRDDLLGVFGAEATIGKSADSDLAEGKYTMLVQKTVELLDKNQQKDFINRISLPNDKMTESDIVKLREYIESSGAKKIVRERIETMYKDAIIAIEKTGASDDIKSLLLDISRMINNVDV